MVAHEDGRARLEVLLALDVEADVEDAAGEVVEAAGDYPIDIVSLSDERHCDGDYDAPDRAQAERRDIERKADIVFRHRV